MHLGLKQHVWHRLGPWVLKQAAGRSKCVAGGGKMWPDGQNVWLGVEMCSSGWKAWLGVETRSWGLANVYNRANK